MTENFYTENPALFSLRHAEGLKNTETVYCNPNVSVDNKHNEIIEYIFDNLEVLKIVLEKDKALSTMLHDMIAAELLARSDNESPTKIRSLPHPPPPTNRRKRWGDED